MLLTRYRKDSSKLGASLPFGYAIVSYSRTSEPIKFERDCDVVLVPQGDNVTLPAGTVGYITQALGGSFTVFVEGNLFRVAGENADAIGKTAPRPLELDDTEDDEAVEKLVWQQLRTCFDPEIPINVVELGLIYEIRISETNEVDIDMTLTSPNCPVAESLPKEVEDKVKAMEAITDCRVHIVFDPPWDKDMMSEEAKLELGFL